MNINEIARLAGVSRATVSRYLNNGYVSNEKKEAIARVIAETGYMPSSHAKSLRTGKTHFVGVIIPKITSESVSRIVAGITDELEEQGYRVLLVNTNNDERNEIKYLRTLTERQVDGIILMATVFTDEHRTAIAEHNVPVVITGQHIEGQTCVYYDDYHAVYDLTQGLYGTCAHPAFLGVTERDVAAGKCRMKAFIDAMGEEGIEQANLIIEQGTFSVESGYEMAKRVLEEHPEVDAMVCATDSIAAGAIAALHTAGRRIPEDVQVTGIGDAEISRAIYPQLSTVHYFYRTSGAYAARMLLDAMADAEFEPVQQLMYYRLILRGSTFNE